MRSVFPTVTMDKKNYLNYLESYLTPRRKSLFHRISKNRTRHFTVVAEDTYKDHNASALVRTCDCFGIQDLYIIEEQNQYRLAKGMAQGAEKWITLNYYNDFEDNAQQCIDNLKEQGYAIIATTPNKHECLLDDYDVNRKSAFFFGKEQTGLSETIMDQADGFLMIPMFGFAESFNISVSAALILQSLIRRLHRNAEIEWHLSEEEMIDLKIDWCLKTIQNGKMIAEKYFEEKR